MSVSVTSNGNQVAAELGRIGYRATRRLTTIIPEAAADVRDEWRGNVEESAGAYAKWYTKSIRYRMLGPLAAIVAPESGHKQADMSFELGSRNQPPHLDGQRALDALARRIERRITSAIDFG